jgi:phage gp29-like protein
MARKRNHGGKTRGSRPAAAARLARRPKLEDDDENGVASTGPSARVFNDWTPKKITAAERQAESGDLTLAVMICDWLLTDDKLAGALDKRCEQLFGLPVGFEPQGDGRRKNRATKALEADEDWWKAYPEAQLALVHKWGLLLGISPARHRWKEFPTHGNRLLPMPRHWHPLTLRRDHEHGQWTIRDRSSKEHIVTPGDGTWVLHQPYGDERPWAYGLWKSLSLWTLLKFWARGDSGAAGEKGSSTVVTSPEGSTKEQRQELAEALLESGSDRLVILAAGYDMKLLEMTAATGQFFKQQIAMADAAITIRITGGNLTTEVKDGGSRAAAEVQERVNEGNKLRFDAETNATTWGEQSLPWWALFNYGDANLSPWPCWPVEPKEDQEKRNNALNVGADAIKKYEELGFELDDDKTIDEFDLSFVTRRKTPEERKKEAEERMQLEQSMQTAQPAPGKTPAPAKAPAKPDDKKKASARGTFAAHLASGTPVSEARGFVAGQMYADDLAESATAAGIEALEPTITAIAEAIEASTGYEDLRERLRALYPTLDNTELQELMYRAMLLGELAGRHAVNRDN